MPPSTPRSVLFSVLALLIVAQARKPDRGLHQQEEEANHHHHTSHHSSLAYSVLKFHQATSSSSSTRSNHVPIGPIKEKQLPEPPATLQPRVFLSENSTLVLAQTGSTPIMHCEVEDIGEGMVSWIRRKDYHLLTVGLATYISDDRFFTAHVRHAQDWALHVKYAQEQDAGLYECQVSTHPPTSLFVELELVEAKAEILGAPDKFVKSGSALRLTCVLRKSTEPPVYVFWYHNDRMVNYDAALGVVVRHGRYSSELEITTAKAEHSGNYSCVPSNTRPASIHVHILNGEKPAAMQHGSKSSAPSWRSQVISLVLLTFYYLMR